MSRRRASNVDASSPIVRLSTASVSGVGRPVAISVAVGSVGIRRLGRMRSRILMLAVNVGNLVARKNIVNASRMARNVGLSVSARIVVMESESSGCPGVIWLRAHFNKPALIINRWRPLINIYYSIKQNPKPYPNPSPIPSPTVSPSQ